MRERLHGFIMEHTGKESVEDLDSLELLELIQAIEADAGIHITDEQIAKLSNEDDLLALISHATA